MTTGGEDEPPATDTDGPRPPGERPRHEPEGGEAVCWLDRVCDACGRLVDVAPPTVCPRCGAPVGGD